MEVARFANTGALQKRDFCLLITLDVKNAFNSAPWGTIVGAMERKKVDLHLFQIVMAYFKDRTLQVGERGTMEVTCGVPQGSVLEYLLR